MIKAVLSFALKNPYLLLGLALAITATLGGVYAKGYLDGKDAARSKSVAVAIDVKEKQDEVQSRRPDVPAIVHSLRRHGL